MLAAVGLALRRAVVQVVLVAVVAVFGVVGDAVATQRLLTGGAALVGRVGVGAAVVALFDAQEDEAVAADRRLAADADVVVVAVAVVALFAGVDDLVAACRQDAGEAAFVGGVGVRLAVVACLGALDHAVAALGLKQDPSPVSADADPNLLLVLAVDHLAVGGELGHLGVVAGDAGPQRRHAVDARGAAIAAQVERAEVARGLAHANLAAGDLQHVVQGPQTFLHGRRGAAGGEGDVFGGEHVVSEGVEGDAARALQTQGRAALLVGAGVIEAQRAGRN